jgi:iron complex outermembrane receptor protein
VVTLYDEPDYVQPEELTAYEIGIKSKWLDGLLRLNVAAFQYEQVNQQVQFVSTFQGGAVSFENAGGSEVDGFDFDATAQLLPNMINDLVLTYEIKRAADSSTRAIKITAV